MVLAVKVEKQLLLKAGNDKETDSFLQPPDARPYLDVYFNIFDL
jgi:hypothetical protein